MVECKSGVQDDGRRQSIQHLLTASRSRLKIYYVKAFFVSYVKVLFKEHDLKIKIEIIIETERRSKDGVPSNQENIITKQES